MSDVVELKKLVKQLQSASSDKEIVDILNVLKKDVKATESLIRESKVGLAVGKLRTHADKNVSEAAKDIVKKWKAEVDREKKGNVKTGPPLAARKGSISTSQPGTPVSPTNGSQIRTAKSDGVQATATGETTRDKCTELLYDGLAFDSTAPSKQILEKAQIIEESAFKFFKGTNAQYKTKIRSLYVNFRDPKNPGLRAGVVSGEIAAEKLPSMESSEMASDQRKAEDKKIQDSNFFNSLGAEEQQAETDAFQCGKCKQRKCRYRQAQTRSADEPMTTFVTCVNCNNRWKFS